MSRPKQTMTVLAQAPLVSAAEGAELEALAAEGLEAGQAELMVVEALERAGEALQMAGRIESLDWVQRISGFQVARAFIALRESKAYRGYPYRDQAGNLKRVSTLEEFCELRMPVSYRRCHQIAANYQALGAELFDATERLGFREADYRAIRALPSEDRAAVELAIASAAERNDKETALSVLAELVARHQAARSAAEAERERALVSEAEIRKDYEAATTLLGETKARLRRLESGELQPIPLDAQMADWPRASGYLTGEIRTALTRIGLLIEAAERAIVRLAPAPGSADEAMVERACRGWYDALGPDLQRLQEEVMGVAGHLERVVGSFAFGVGADADGGAA